VLAVQRYVQQGYRIVVDVNLSKLFDRLGVPRLSWPDRLTSTSRIA
jgi:hypothetical protein